MFEMSPTLNSEHEKMILKITVNSNKCVSIWDAYGMYHPILTIMHDTFRNYCVLCIILESSPELNILFINFFTYNNNNNSC